MLPGVGVGRAGALLTPPHNPAGCSVLIVRCALGHNFSKNVIPESVHPLGVGGGVSGKTCIIVEA